MSLSNNQLKKLLGAQKKVPCSDEKLKETICKATTAFAENEAEEMISHAEFIYQQSKYIHKRWWILQGLLLFLLWLLLQLTRSNYYAQRCMGVAASLFAILLLPELWKNRNENALEIESVSFYSLRQIYSARMLAFAFIDCLLLGAFALPTLITGKVLIEELMIQFFLPFIVSCCICFRVLYSNKIGSEIFALFLCVVWCAVWTQIVLNKKIYELISLPVWSVMTGVAFFYLGYCVYKGQNGCMKMWEEMQDGIKNY